MHSEVKRLADQGDIAGLRYIFADALDVDPTFEQYQADYDYCQSKGLLEPHQEFTPLTDEPSQWTKDYWAHLKVDLLKNLSARRLTHMKKVAQVLMEDKIQCLTAERQAAQWVARPGTSEHNLGLAADIVSADWYAQHDDLTADFDQTPAFAWLREHCADYGFILRYPLGKESVTGVTYEPWHYRYVGEEAARAIMDAQLTLEEYLQQQGASNA